MNSERRQTVDFKKVFILSTFYDSIGVDRLWTGMRKEEKETAVWQER